MTKEERRQAMPVVTEWVDAFRFEFGELVEIKAQENGHAIEWQKAQAANE